MEPRRIKPGGTIRGIAMAGPDNVYLLVRQAQGTSCLLQMDLEGGTRWQLDLPEPVHVPFSIPRHEMRVAEDGSAWLGEGRTLTRIACRLNRMLKTRPGCAAFAAFVIVGMILACRQHAKEQRLCQGDHSADSAEKKGGGG